MLSLYVVQCFMLCCFLHSLNVGPVYFAHLPGFQHPPWDCYLNNNNFCCQNLYLFPSGSLSYLWKKSKNVLKLLLSFLFFFPRSSVWWLFLIAHFKYYVFKKTFSFIKFRELQFFSHPVSRIIQVHHLAQHRNPKTDFTYYSSTNVCHL